MKAVLTAQGLKTALWHSESELPSTHRVPRAQGAMLNLAVKGLSVLQSFFFFFVRVKTSVKHRDLPACTCQALGLKVCITTPGRKPALCLLISVLAHFYSLKGSPSLTRERVKVLAL